MCDEFIIKGKLQLKQLQKEKPEIDNKKVDSGLDTTWTCVLSITSLFMWKKKAKRSWSLLESAGLLDKDKMRINSYLLTRSPYY